MIALRVYVGLRGLGDGALQTPHRLLAPMSRMPEAIRDMKKTLEFEEFEEFEAFEEFDPGFFAARVPDWCRPYCI